MKRLIYLLGVLYLANNQQIEVISKIPYVVDFVVEDHLFQREVYPDDLKDIYAVKPTLTQGSFMGWYYDQNYTKPFLDSNQHDDHFTLYAKLSYQQPFIIVNTAV